MAARSHCRSPATPTIATSDTKTLNGDINEESLDQALYQPGAAERAALAAAGYGAVPASGLDATNTPFPSLRCIGNALLNDEPSEKCNGLINRTTTTQRNGGASGQLTHRAALAGQRQPVHRRCGAFDRSGVSFAQSTELGYLNPDRSVTGVGAFGDGGSRAATPTVSPTTRGSIWMARSRPAVSTPPTRCRSATARTCRSRAATTARPWTTAISSIPAAGPGRSTATHVFARFNPAAGLTFDLRRRS